MKRIQKIKKLIATFFGVLFLGVANVYAGVIDLSVGPGNPMPAVPGHGKAPVEVPSLWQDGHELTFQSMHPDYAIDIVQNGIVAYSVDVDESTTAIVLPSWLSGDCEILLYPEDNDYYFYGVISL